MNTKYQSTSNRDQIGKRIEELIYELRMNKNSFAVKIGSTSTSINNIVIRNHKPRFEMLQKITDAFPQVNQSWLISGEGPMFKDQEPTPPNTPTGGQGALAAKSADGGAYGQEVLNKILNEIIKLNETIKNKDSQIEQLITLLGKPPLSKEKLPVKHFWINRQVPTYLAKCK
jgi:transcriptional regulator with XRE-family HTH domain